MQQWLHITIVLNLNHKRWWCLGVSPSIMENSSSSRKIGLFLAEGKNPTCPEKLLRWLKPYTYNILHSHTHYPCRLALKRLPCINYWKFKWTFESPTLKNCIWFLSMPLINSNYSIMQKIKIASHGRSSRAVHLPLKNVSVPYLLI